VEALDNRVSEAMTHYSKRLESPNVLPADRFAQKATFPTLYSHPVR